MASYWIRFIGNIIEAKRPDGFPKEIYHDLYVDKISKATDLRDAINNECKMFIMQQGMVVPKDQDEMVDETKENLDKRIFVPMHMVAFISTVTKRLVAEIPNEDNGKGAQIQ